jgi:hypothetical protein
MGTDGQQNSAAARALSGALEPLIGSVFFARECHEAYVGLGFAPSTRLANGVMLPDGPAYFTSRGSLLGQVPGQVVAAAFGVFSPPAVVASVNYGWTLTNATHIRQVRADAVVAQLRRILGTDIHGLATVRAALKNAVAACEPAGRALFAGAVSGAEPSDDLAAVWHLGECLREYRGDSHTAAWISEGLDAIEIGLLTELYWGLASKSYVRTRAWSDEQLDAGTDRMQSRGLIADGSLTETGRALRESIERSTDAQMRPVLTALGTDHEFQETIDRLVLWSAQVKAAHGYPSSGPMDLANAVNKG